MLNNDVIDVQKQGSGIAKGISLPEVSDGLAVNNRITNADVGIDFGVSTGKYRDNLTTGVPTANRFLGGTDAGGND